MTSRHLFLALSVGALAVSSASAAVETRQLTITNDTGEPWSRVVFYLLGDVVQDAGRFNAIRFVDDLALQSSPQSPVTKSILDAPTNDRLAFDFQSQSMLAPGGSYEFTLSVDNPYNEYFTVGWRAVVGRTVPAPAAGASLAALVALGAMRRRRS